MTDDIKVRSDGLPLGYFPGPVTPTETRLNRELNEAYTEIAALKAALQVKTEAADFWHGAYKRLAEKLTEAKRND